MFFEIIWGFVVYKLFRLFFQDDALDIETFDTDAIFSVAARYFFTLLYPSANFVNRSFELFTFVFYFLIKISSLQRWLYHLWRLAIVNVLNYSFLKKRKSENCLQLVMVLLHIYLCCRLEKLYGVKAHVGLRIPDADTSTRQGIDIALVTKG